MIFTLPAVWCWKEAAHWVMATAVTIAVGQMRVVHVRHRPAVLTCAAKNPSVESCQILSPYCRAALHLPVNP